VAYFSDREQGPKPRTGTEITEGAWKGIVIAIGRRVTDGSFGQSFPEMCDDGRGPVGTNEKILRDAIESEIPDLEWPWRGRELPSTYDALDFIEFCYRHIASPIKGDWHPFFGHHHLDFESEPGKTEFREQINTIFSRNGLAFDLTAEGQIVRLAPVVLDKALVGAVFKTGDAELDKILETAKEIPVAEHRHPEGIARKTVGRLRAAEDAGDPGGQEEIGRQAPVEGLVAAGNKEAPR
jgi:hypothetical protein